MKVCSFLPAATQMIYDMGMEHLLYGVTFECPPGSVSGMTSPAFESGSGYGSRSGVTSPQNSNSGQISDLGPGLDSNPGQVTPQREKLKVVRCVLEGKNYSSGEIDKIFAASKAQGKSLYYVDEEALQQIQPDIIFTQDVCEVCQIDTACTAAAVSKLKKQPQLIPLSPTNLQDVFRTAITIATALGNEEAAYRYLSLLQSRLDIILDTLRRNRMPLKRVMLMEWMEPVYNCGHWIPFQVAQAGGIDMLSNPGGDSIVVPWEKISKYNPEVLIIAPCGFDTARSKKELHLLTAKAGWNELEAVKTKQVYLADYDLFTQPSASTLVNGIELLAALFHPELFRVPLQLLPKYVSYFQQQPAHV